MVIQRLLRALRPGGGTGQAREPDSGSENGPTRIADLVDRSIVDVSGVVRTLTHPAVDGGPHLQVDLDDGSGSVRLVWLGRREIQGIDPGVRLRVHGRLTRQGGAPTVFNPRYEIVPRR